MNKSTLLFFFALVVIVVSIARCNSRSRLAQEREQQATSPLVPTAASPSSSPSPSATPVAQVTATPLFDATKAAANVQPAVVSVSVFEPSGKLLRTGTGVFVSNDGKILTTRSLMEGGAHAIARTSDNKIHNVDGILVDTQSDDLALLGCEIKNQVPFVSPDADAIPGEGAKVAVVQSPLGKGKAPVIENTVSKKHNDNSQAWLELSSSVTSNGLGAPVVNSRGEVIGLVTRGPGEPAVVVRPSATLNALVARAPADNKAKWFVQENPVSPGEGALQKVPLAENSPSHKSKLIYSPLPAYPSAARSSYGATKGTGKFRVTFDSAGQVKNIVILRSTQNGALDQAAVDALRRWKAAPGEEWTLNVPVTFQ